MKIAIVDDEEIWRDRVAWALEEYFDGRQILLHTFPGGEELLECRIPFDGIIMDVEMPGIDGMTLMNEYRSRYPDTCVIMLSSHGEWMGEGYRQNAFRYVEKERMETDLPEALESLRYVKSEGSEVEIREIGEGTCYVYDEQIRYLESVGHVTRVVTAGQEYRTTVPLKEFFRQLDPGKFYLCHRAFCLNWRYVKEIEAGEAILDQGERIPVSQRKISEARQRFWYYKFHRANG